MLAVTATLQVRYYAANSVLRARRERAATQLASIIITDWKSSENLNFDLHSAIADDYPISAAAGQETPSGFIRLGSYKITNNQKDCLVTLSYKEKTQNAPAILNVRVARPQEQNLSQELLCSLTMYMDL